MSAEGRLEHRRIDTSSETVTPDPDWASLNTSPTFGADLAGGEIKPIQLRDKKPVIWLKAYDGLGDDAQPVAESTATVTIEVVSFHQNRGKWVPYAGQELEVQVNRRLTERDLALEDASVIRVKSGTVGVADVAIWVFVSSSTTE